MFICEIWLFDWYYPQFCKSDMSKYGYLEVFLRVSSTSRYRESTVLLLSHLRKQTVLKLRHNVVTPLFKLCKPSLKTISVGLL